MRAYLDERERAREAERLHQQRIEELKRSIKSEEVIREQVVARLTSQLERMTHRRIAEDQLVGVAQ